MDPIRGILGLDFETASAANLKLVAAWAYSRHPSTRVYCAGFGYDEGPGTPRRFWRWRPGVPLPAEIVDYVRAGGSVLAHNCAFERSIIANILVPFFDWPIIPLDQWRDTQASGRFFNLPSKLEGLAKALGCPAQKDMEGYDLMREMADAVVSMPDGSWVYPMATEANLRRLEDYNRLDIAAMMDSWHRMAPLPVTELLAWRVDQRINNRGVYLDQEFASRIQRMAEERSRKLQRQAHLVSATELENAVAAPALKKWLALHNVKLPVVTKRKADGSFHKVPSAGKAQIAELLEGGSLTPQVRVVLENRQEANKATSLAKLNRIAPSVGGDGRLRNALQFCAAHTGRWSSAGVQLHNLPKNDQTEAQAALVRAIVDAGNLELLEWFEDKPLSALSQSLRSVVCAPRGKELIGADFSGIEARVCAWLAGQDNVVEFFHEFDREKRAGRKPTDFYIFTAEACDLEDRQSGKLAALSLQYGMGDVKLIATAAGRGVVLTPLRARAVKRAWRDANQAIVDLWANLEAAARSAIEHRGTEFVAGRLRMVANKSCLAMVLPSGRTLRYWSPRIELVKRVWQVVDDAGVIVSHESESEELQFLAPGKDQVRTALQHTYGGKLVENATQAVSRDLMSEAIIRIEAATPYEPVIHVHDSCAAEVPAGKGDVAEFCRLMEVLPSWAEGCPIAAAGYRDRRFRG